MYVLTEAYRYLISAKVIDQLEEFDIKPCYERICRALYNCAKTPKQMKLLWGSILRSAGNRPDCINSSHVTKMWKMLCNDKKYTKICHYEDEIMSRIEKSLNKRSKDEESKDNDNKEENTETTETTEKTKTNNEDHHKNTLSINTQTQQPQYSFYPSPVNVPVIPSNDNKPFESINININNNNINNNSNNNYCNNSNSNTINTSNNNNTYYNSPNPQVKYQIISSTCIPSPSIYPSPVSINEPISYSISSSPMSACSSVSCNEIIVNPINSNTLSVPSINVIECPVVEIQQYPSQPINIQNSKLFSNYQGQPQCQPQCQPQPQQIVYYY